MSTKKMAGIIMCIVFAGAIVISAVLFSSEIFEFVERLSNNVLQERRDDELERLGETENDESNNISVQESATDASEMEPIPEPTGEPIPEPTPEPTSEPTPVSEPINLPEPVIRNITNEVIAVTATSELGAQTDSAGIRRYYNVENLIDGNDDTIWCEGVSGVGIGESVTFYFGDTGVTITGIEIKNGYWIAEDAYVNNGYVTKLTVDFGSGRMESFSLSEQSYSQRSAQKIEFSKPYATEYMCIVIDDAIGGVRWEDTCITEIIILGYIQ